MKIRPLAPKGPACLYYRPRHAQPYQCLNAHEARPVICQRNSAMRNVFYIIGVVVVVIVVLRLAGIA